MGKTQVMAAAGLALAACGGPSVVNGVNGNAAGPIVPAPASSAAVPADPVTILLKTGATPDPGTKVGSYDIEGDRYASGEFDGPGGAAGDADGESVDVYTFASQAALAYNLSINGGPSDGEARIEGPGLSLTTISSPVDLQTGGPVAFGSPLEYGPTPQVIARRIGGRVLWSE